MNKQIIITMLALFCFATKSFAADISGQIRTSDGQPVCALVLASGVDKFSCDPIGLYSLQGLFTEPNGSITLQIYAAGFLPYITTLTQFGPQPAVTMIRSVDNGLSDTSPLDGTYRLLRTTVIYNDGSGFDSAAPIATGVSASGTMVINGNFLSQTIDLVINGIPQPRLTVNDTFVDFGFALQSGATGTPLAVVERGLKLITATNGNNIGSNAAEVDQWVKVTSTVLSLESDLSSQSYTSSTAPIGGLLGAMAEGQGLKLMPDK